MSEKFQNRKKTCPRKFPRKFQNIESSSVTKISYAPFFIKNSQFSDFFYRMAHFIEMGPLGRNRMAKSGWPNIFDQMTEPGDRI